MYLPPKCPPNTRKGGNIALTPCKTVEKISLTKKRFLDSQNWNSTEDLSVDLPGNLSP